MKISELKKGDEFILLRTGEKHRVTNVEVICTHVNRRIALRLNENCKVIFLKKLVIELLLKFFLDY